MSEPSKTDPNGRDRKGRFGPGNQFAQGNPFAKRMAHLRAVALDATTEQEFKAVWAALVEKAKAGDIAAIKEFLDRVIGKAPNAPDVDDEADRRLRPIEEVVADIHRAVKANRNGKHGE